MGIWGLLTPHLPMKAPAVVFQALTCSNWKIISSSVPSALAYFRASSSVTQNIIGGLFGKKLEQKQSLVIARVTVLIVAIIGMVIGATLIGVINLGMIAVNLDQHFQYIVKGFVLLAAVVFDILSKKKQK